MVDDDLTTASELRLVFDAVPVPLWIEDFSRLKVMLDGWRELGVADLAAHLADHPDAIDAAIEAIHVIAVNSATVELLGAASADDVLLHSSQILRRRTGESFPTQLELLWRGELTASIECVHQAVDGSPIDVLLQRRLIPGHEHSWGRVLVATIDITDRKRQARELEVSRRQAVSMFEHSPISLWLEDYSRLKIELDVLRTNGVTDLDDHIRTYPGFLARCSALIEVVDVNQRTLDLFRAQSKQALLRRANEIFAYGAEEGFRQELDAMWRGELAHSCEAVNHTLDGDRLDVTIDRLVQPGFEGTWERVLLSVVDVTARKRADEYMRFLGTHDALTGLHNRSHFDAIIRSLQVTRPAVVSVLIADLNGLKQANDQHGHAAGDDLIRRAADVLREAVGGADVSARIGGDEFAALLPGSDEDRVAALVKQVRSLIKVNNDFHRGPALSMAIGTATMRSDGSVTEALRVADARMYADKAGRGRADARSDITG